MSKFIGISTATSDQTVSEHYQQHSEAIQTIIKDLDGYSSDISGLDQTVSEHYNQHSSAIQTIIKSLDGYGGISATEGSDGYIAFFTGANSIAGDNDLFWNRESHSLKLSGGPGVSLIFGDNTKSPAFFNPQSNQNLYLKTSDSLSWSNLWLNQVRAFDLVQCGSGASFRIVDRARLTSASLGTITLKSYTTDDFTTLIFGDETNSYPAIKRVGDLLQIRLGDDSEFGILHTSNLDAYGPVKIHRNNIDESEFITINHNGTDGYVYSGKGDIKLLTNTSAQVRNGADDAYGDFACGKAHVEEFELSDTVWDDLRTPVSAIRLAGAQPPSSQIYKGSEVLSFPSNADKTIYFSFQLPHTRKPDTNVHIHLHWTIPVSGAGGGAENVKWDLTYSWANLEDTFPAESSSTMTVDVQNDAADTHMYDEFAELDGTGKTLSSVILCSLTRDTTVANDYASDTYLVQIDAHCEIDTLGSRTELDK